MYTSVRRAGGFAAVATLSLLAPVAGVLAAVPFALFAAAGWAVSGGPFFELFARPADRREGELRGLVGFSLAAAGLAILASLAGLPTEVFVATVLLVGYGNLLERVLCDRGAPAIQRATTFALGGALAGFGGQVVALELVGEPIHAPTAGFLALVGALVGALVRSASVERDDPLVLVSIALVLWALAGLDLGVETTELAIAVGIAGAFGYLSWLLRTASVTGMLTGVGISLVTIVLGGYGWFAIIITFFALGGLASKFRYEEKRDLGVAEDNDGARGSRNVLGNAAIALLAVIGFAAADRVDLPTTVFLFAFAGSVATAMSDTLSSEIGVLFGTPRLLTTLEPVEPGTDGGVTVEGGLAGLLGAAAIAGITVVAFDVTPPGVALIALAGAVGMLVDSLLGATLEGGWFGNQAVNFLATLAGAILAGSGALYFGLA